MSRVTGWLYGLAIDPHFVRRARVHVDYWREQRATRGRRAIKADEIEDLLTEVLSSELQQMFDDQHNTILVARLGVWQEIENLLNNPVPDDAAKLATMRRMIEAARVAAKGRNP